MPSSPHTQVADPSKYGVVVMDDNMKVERFVEKPQVCMVGVRVLGGASVVTALVPALVVLFCVPCHFLPLACNLLQPRIHSIRPHIHPF